MLSTNSNCEYFIPQVAINSCNNLLATDDLIHLNHLAENNFINVSSVLEMNLVNSVKNEVNEGNFLM
jgi:hypothetical protein